MNAKCDDLGGGRLYYQGRSDEEWRVQYLSYYPHTDIEKLFDTHIYELASKLILTKEEEAAAADPNNDQWEDMPEEEEKELIEAGDVALQKYKTYKKKEKKKKSTGMSSGINKNNKEKTKKTEPEKKKKEKVDFIARFKNTNRTYMTPKSFLKWHQQEENQDKPDLVKFFNYKKNINEFKRLLIEDGKTKWEVDEEPGDNLEEGVDYI